MSTIVMKMVEKHVKQHRPIDWFALVILISFAFVIASVLANHIEQFEHDMEQEAQHATVYMLYLQESQELKRAAE